jgi:hypothetical protein
MEIEKRSIVINWSVSLGIFLLAFCLPFFLRGDYSYRGLSDAFFFASLLEFAILFFVAVNRFGLFDAVYYSFHRMGESFHPDAPKRWNTYNDYRIYKKDARASGRMYVWSYVTLGGLSLLLAVVFLIVFDVYQKI